MKNEQKIQHPHEGKPKKNPKKRFSVHVPSLTPKTILRWSKGRAFRIITAIIAVIVFAGCVNEAFDYTEQAMSDEAYKYSDEVYKNIELAVQNYLGDDGPDIAALQENVPEFITRIESTYEDEQTVLVCTKENGLFTAEVTSIIAKEFYLKGSHVRNFNSFQEYKNFFWKTFKVEVAKRALGIFLVIAVVWLAVTSTILLVLKKVVESEEKKAKHRATNPETVVTENKSPMEVAVS